MAVPGRARLDHAVTAAILGFFGSAWFGWAHVGAPSWVNVVLDISSAVAILVVLIAMVMAFRGLRGRLVSQQPGRLRRYGLIVGVECASAGLGVAVLALMHAKRWAPVWVLIVIAVHFFPLAPVLGNPSLRTLGWLLGVVALTGAVVGLRSGLQPAVVTGIGAGTMLVAFASGELRLGLAAA